MHPPTLSNCPPDYGRISVEPGSVLYSHNSYINTKSIPIDVRHLPYYGNNRHQQCDERMPLWGCHFRDFALGCDERMPLWGCHFRDFALGCDERMPLWGYHFRDFALGCEERMPLWGCHYRDFALGCEERMPLWGLPLQGFRLRV